MKKTKEQAQAMRRMKMFPLLWHVTNDYGDGLLAMNWLTGEFRYIDK